MGTYVLRRLLLMIPTLLGITLINFAIMRLAPGDPVALSIGGPAASAEGGGGGDSKARGDIVRQAKIDLGLLDRDGNPIPLWRQYVGWLGRTVTLDFGRSFKDKRPVLDKIAESVPVTMFLDVVALIVTYCIAIPTGVFSARHRNTVADHSISTALFLLWSIPGFLAGTLLILTVGRAGWLPFVGLHSEGHERLAYLPWVADMGKHLVLPLFCMTYASFVGLSRYVRTGLLENLALDYVRTARAKGLPENRVVYGHALRNSLIPVVTFLASLLPAMIGGSIILETIFTINGMGYLSFQSVLNRDYPVIMAISTIAAVLTMLGILLSDLLYCVVDPRISLQ